MFALAHTRGNNVTNENLYRKYFLPRLKIKNYNIEIEGRNFYDQSINDLIKQYDEVRKISTRQVDDYMTCCSLLFNKLFLLEKQIIQIGSITFLNNQIKQY